MQYRLILTHKSRLASKGKMQIPILALLLFSKAFFFFWLSGNKGFIGSLCLRDGSSRQKCSPCKKEAHENLKWLFIKSLEKGRLSKLWSGRSYYNEKILLYFPSFFLISSFHLFCLSVPLHLPHYYLLQATVIFHKN